MIPFWAETLLLMAAAYFLGAALACVIRRSLAPATVQATPAERRVDPLPEVAALRAQPLRAAEPAPGVSAAQRSERQDLKSIQGEICGGRPIQAQEQPADDGGAGTRHPGYQGKHLAGAHGDRTGRRQL